ncbi:hypothetical protein [Pseudoduganella umbonata]|uniref:Uncharacterized protein n=2 Tax=Pseudoduganella umbonata TaxID=864828 RepID=A0A4P8HNQ2_9BURK|nr:hypothetical protein [Pseudoduganella umbonata]MBB3220064.1 hypothetical protein [Pseudoduganella umbonata]QCP10068.1 hypothetical protein FCL38_06235 [Pseudoduganella umbonata]
MNVPIGASMRRPLKEMINVAVVSEVREGDGCVRHAALPVMPDEREMRIVDRQSRPRSMG